MSHETGKVPDLAEVADRLAIFDVLAQHSRGVDRVDVAVLKSAYWPDATVAYGGFNGSAHEFCEILPGAIQGYKATQHAVSNIAIAISGDDARVESYCTAYHYAEVQGGPDREMTYIGRYLDRMQKRAGTWKILHRIVVMTWNQNFDASAVWAGPPIEGLAVGARGPDDPLYAFLRG